MIALKIVQNKSKELFDKINSLEQDVKDLIQNKSYSLDERWGIFKDFCENFKRGKVEQRIDFSLVNKEFQEHIEDKCKNENNGYNYNEEVELIWEFDDYYQVQKFKEKDENILLKEMYQLQEFCMNNFVFTFLNCN